MGGLVVWPQIAYLVSQSQALSPRAAEVVVWLSTHPTWGVSANKDQLGAFWFNQIRQSFLAFVSVSDAGIFYGRFGPLVGWAAVVPLLIGIGGAIRRFRSSEWGLLLIWISGSAFLGSVLLTNPPEFQRLVLATPALAVLIAGGLMSISNGLMRLSKWLTPTQPIPPLAERWLYPVGLALFVVILNLKGYAIDYRAAQPYFRDRRTRMVNEIADKVLPFLQGYTIWVARSPATALSESSVIAFKDPTIATIELIGAEDSVYATVAKATGKRAIIIPPDYPSLNILLDRLAHVPGARYWPLAHTLNQEDASAIVFTWDLP